MHFAFVIAQNQKSSGCAVYYDGTFKCGGLMSPGRIREPVPDAIRKAQVVEMMLTQSYACVLTQKRLCLCFQGLGVNGIPAFVASFEAQSRQYGEVVAHDYGICGVLARESTVVCEANVSGRSQTDARFFATTPRDPVMKLSIGSIGWYLFACAIERRRYSIVCWGLDQDVTYWSALFPKTYTYQSLSVSNGIACATTSGAFVVCREVVFKRVPRDYDRFLNKHAKGLVKNVPAMQSFSKVVVTMSSVCAVQGLRIVKHIQIDNRFFRLYCWTDKGGGLDMDQSPMYDTLRVTANVGSYAVGSLTLPCAKGVESRYPNSVSQLCTGPCGTGDYGVNGECLPCPAGNWCANSTRTQYGSEPTACAAGEYTQSMRQLACSACPAGSSANYTGAHACAPCVAGRATRGLEMQTRCEACERGKR
jgi:hypothetical protein